MIKVNLLLFGAAADAAGIRETAVETIDGISVAQFIDHLIERHQGLAGMRLLAALNEEYVPAETPISAGDTVAVFCPVSGG